MKYLLTMLLTASVVAPLDLPPKPVVDKAALHRQAQYNRIMEANVPCDIKAKDLLFILEKPGYEDNFYSDVRLTRLRQILGD